MASTDFRVLTPERVSLQYDIAGIGSRGAAALVDSLLQTAAVTVLVLAVSGAGLLIGAFVSSGLSSVVTVIAVYATLALAVFVITFGYFILFEIIWSGQTPGKRLLGLRVIRDNGYPIRPVDAVIRNLLRVFDGLPFFYAVGVLTMLFNARSKRLGDFAAGTLVVREGARSHGAFADTIEPLESQGAGFSLRGEDATLVRDFLVRRSGMNPSARADLAARLANALSTRYGLTVETDPEAFLERLGA